VREAKNNPSELERAFGCSYASAPATRASSRRPPASFAATSPALADAAQGEPELQLRSLAHRAAGFFRGDVSDASRYSLGQPRVEPLMEMEAGQGARTTAASRGAAGGQRGPRVRLVGKDDGGLASSGNPPLCSCLS